MDFPPFFLIDEAKLKVKVLEGVPLEVVRVEKGKENQFMIVIKFNKEKGDKDA